MMVLGRLRNLTSKICDVLDAKLSFALMVVTVLLPLYGEVRRLTIDQWRTTPPVTVEVGDLVFRRDNGVWSKIFINASTRERRFSHAGIVTRKDGHIEITHADANERTGVGCVRSEDWSGFFSESIDGALFRYAGGSAVRKLIVDEARSRLNVPFDTGFDMTQTNKLYCSEFVREAVNSAVGRQVIGYTNVALNKGFVAVDDCYRNEMILIAECCTNDVSSTKDCKK